MEKITVAKCEEIVSVVKKYVEGCKRGDSSLMRGAFDKGAVMYGYLNGQLYDGSIDNLYDAVDALGGDDAAKWQIDILDIQETTAVVRVILEDWHQIAFVDFHSLIKLNGQWKISAKVFHQF